jgi:F420-non-reducing hydrogenase iron-sulfur subunit
MKKYEPRIVIFCCNWCSYAGADLAGVSRFQIDPHFRVIRTMCSGRVEPEFILSAFQNGADGVMITGCHPGDCHYISGNYKAIRRFHFMKVLLNAFGVDTERMELHFISAGEGIEFQKSVNLFVEKIRKLGPVKARAKEIDHASK